MTSAALDCLDLEKAFGGVPVLKGVSLSLEPGTVTALAGENGAGKSTLMKIATGQYKADRGQVLMGGSPLSPGDPQDAVKHGLAIIPQELASIMDMTVYENLFVGREIKNRLGLLNRSAMAKRAKQMLEVFEIDIDPQRHMRQLPVGLRQLVEIAKNASRGAQVLLLDEPTSAISEREVAHLYTVINTLRSQGVAMIYTTHKMAEIRAVADRVVVLRDGGLVTDRPLAEITDDQIVEAMIGRELEDLFPDRGVATDEVALRLNGLSVAGFDSSVDLSVRRGEIVGLAGLVGAGRTELLEGIFGVRKTTAGTVEVSGRSVRRNDPAAAIARNVALVPEDRKGAGAVLTMDVLDNGSLPRLSSFTAAGFLKQVSRRKAVDKAMSSVSLRSRGLGQTVGTLSGGNQQKVVLARWLTGKVDVLLLDEPTRGVDVGARSEIYRIITELAASGMAVLMASSDMPEILGLSHRACVMRGGAIVSELDRSDLDDPEIQNVIFRLAAGMDLREDIHIESTDASAIAMNLEDAG